MLSRLKYRFLLSIFLCISILISFQSCQEEFVDEDVNDRIELNVTGDTWTVTKSEEDVQEIPLEVDGTLLSLILSTEDNCHGVCTDGGPATRGAAYDNSYHKVSAIRTTAIIENGTGGNIYINDEDISIIDGKGRSTHFWPEKPLSFFAYTVSKDNGTMTDPVFQRVDGKCKGTFTYTLPAAAATAPKKDATNQPDIIFAITPDHSKNDGTEVDLVFHHALSAIIFKVGSMPEDVYLNSIAIDGVNSSGNCSMTPSDGKDVRFLWTSQNQPGRYTEDIEKKAVTGDQMGGDEAVFMMVPQTLSNAAKLILSFTISGKTLSLEKCFNEIIAEWEADKRYVFTIGLPDEFEVEVEDQVVGAVKKDVTITNTGVSSGYVRAAIIGYWVNNKGDITMPWLETDGEFVWGSQWSRYWKKGRDGFYYYLQPLPAKTATQYPLFETYTLKTSTEIGTNHAFMTLELNIAVQIIPEENKSLWPEIGTI